MGRQKGRRRSATGRIRVIGGEWRGRQLPVPDSDGLRPTGDRLRETLFNWLAPRINGARCLDLFAGSGALGIEALSRGAAHCDFVETNGAIVQSLRATLDALGAGDRSVVHAADALRFLDAWPARDDDGSGRWDIVFIDPPFAGDLATEALAALVRGLFLGQDGLIYLENARDNAPVLPEDLSVLRQSGGAAVEARLLEPGADGGTAVA